MSGSGDESGGDGGGKFRARRVESPPVRWLRKAVVVRVALEKSAPAGAFSGEESREPQSDETSGVNLPNGIRQMHA